MKSKAGKILLKVFAAIIVVLVLIAGGFGIYFANYTPSVTFDAGNLTGEVTNGASGYLYGIAQDGVPSYEMTASLDVSSVSAKTQGGLQHPIGEVGDIASEVLSDKDKTCDYIVVYLQDMYSTWYYDHINIEEMKANGEYDFKNYIETEYFPLIEQTVSELKNADYHDKLVYCIYNEPDNGVWFDDRNRSEFYEAWKLTYDYVKSLDETALIGGPGFYEYDSDKINGFFEYTSANDCTPQVIIYHELNYRALYDWQFNADDLKEIEAKYGVDTATPVIVTEYGMMEDNGNPNTMLRYIARIENSKVYANQAYWLLADNFCNTCADYNTPNSAWWVYRWYAEMTGQTMKMTESDILHSDMGKAILGFRAPRYRQFLGLGTVDNAENKIDLLVSGADYDGVVKIENLDTTSLYGKNINVTVSAVTYQGISGKVYKPETVQIYNTVCSNDNITIDMSGFMNENTAYHIEITASDDSDGTEFLNDNLYIRYEFENGTLLGDAYTYDSAYATTGEQNGMVGGMEKDGDGVEIEIEVPEDGNYELKFIYGNSNDGKYDENGRQHPDERAISTVNFALDGSESSFSLENTIKSELTSGYEMVCELTAGRHTIKITHNKGTIVLDSLLVRREDTDINLAVLEDGGDGFFAVSPYDGYYDIVFDSIADVSIGLNGYITVPTNAADTVTVFLKRGLNYLRTSGSISYIQPSTRAGAEWYFEPRRMALDGTAEIKTVAYLDTEYVTGISSDGGSAEVTLNTEYAGNYALTILYANNHEQGVHDYNVDLIEDCVTLSVNGKVQKNLYCRNTYSWDSFTTVVTDIELEQGENHIVLYNDGSNLFNGTPSYAPNIAAVIVNDYTAK